MKMDDDTTGELVRGYLPGATEREAAQFAARWQGMSRGKMLADLLWELRKREHHSSVDRQAVDYGELGENPFVQRLAVIAQRNEGQDAALCREIQTALSSNHSCRLALLVCFGEGSPDLQHLAAEMMERLGPAIGVVRGDLEPVLKEVNLESRTVRILRDLLEALP